MCSSDLPTRRLVHICEAYAIFNQNRMKAIELCLNRFDIDTKTAFMELYKKVDEDAVETPVAESASADLDKEVAFWKAAIGLSDKEAVVMAKIYGNLEV